MVFGRKSEGNEEVLFSIQQTDDSRYVNYNVDVSNPNMAIALIKFFKEEIMRLEEILKRVDAEEMYEKRMERFDEEDLREGIEEKEKILGYKFESI